MNNLRILHNGDLRKDSPHPSPHWMVHIREDGNVWGELLTLASGRLLPKDFTITNPNAFFDIPEELRHHKLQTQPHAEEIIVCLVETPGHWVCSFAMSQLPQDSSMRAALDALVQKINDLAVL